MLMKGEELSASIVDKWAVNLKLKMKTNRRLLLELKIKAENDPTTPQDFTYSKESKMQLWKQKKCLFEWLCLTSVYTQES